MKRETAWRVFAGEYNDASFEIKGSGEKIPSYVITPLGSKINRIFVIGVLTDVENVSEGGEYLRAHLSDPTGVFTIYSGQFQQEATDALMHIEVPTFVAIVGKARTYQPDDGGLYVSLRPELVREVNAEARDRWIIETCMQTTYRIGAMREALKMNQPNAYDLRQLGYGKDLSLGIVTALKNYDSVDIDKYLAMVRESLNYIAPDREQFDLMEEQETIDHTEHKKKKTEVKSEEETPEDVDPEDAEKLVLSTIKELEGDEGAAWDLIISKCREHGLDENTIDEALNALMEKGMIFEPVLGTIKTT